MAPSVFGNSGSQADDVSWTTREVVRERIFSSDSHSKKTISPRHSFLPGCFTVIKLYDEPFTPRGPLAVEHVGHVSWIGLFKGHRREMDGGLGASRRPF